MKLKREAIPKDHEVQPLAPGAPAEDRVTCGACGLSWDDGIGTSYTPAPSGRCPFEYFHAPDPSAQPAPGPWRYDPVHEKVLDRDGEHIWSFEPASGPLAAAAPALRDALAAILKEANADPKRPVQCQDCGWIGRAEDLAPSDGPSDLGPGEAKPIGACPKCDWWFGPPLDLAGYGLLFQAQAALKAAGVV